MPSIGDITGRIVIQDVGSPAAIKFGENLEKASKTIMASMSRATLATETAVREISSKLAKLRTETKETAAGKGLVNDLDSLIKKRQQELTALKSGPAAIEALNQKRYQEAQALKIAAAQVQAGVSAESYLGRTIAANIKTLDRYEQELDQLAKAQALSAQKAQQQVAAFRKLSDVGQTLTSRVTLPLVALGVGAVKVASDFESSFAGVRKTVDATEEEFAQLQAQLRALASGPDAIPIDVNKLNAVAEAAGQLGIAKQDIIAFTRTMADLGQTTNLTADEAATATAQFQNIFGAAGKEVDRFGSTLVALGNAGASTEKDIISMGLRIAGAGVQLGLSQGQVLAYASALSSMGIEAEAGGSAISKVMIDIALAVSKGGNELLNFASVAGMTTDQFKTMFQTDAAGAVASFIEGLGRMKESGQDVLGTLDAMGITEVRMRDALLRASGAGDLLRNSLKLQAEAWRDNNALTNEAEKRYQTFESQLQLFLNRVKDITITFGTALLPALLDALDAAQPWIDTLKSMAEGFAGLSPVIQKVVLVLGTLVAAAGPAIFITGQLLLAWNQIITLGPGVVTSIRAVAGAMNGLFLVSAGLIAVGLLINGIINKWRAASEAVTQYNLEVAKVEGNALAFAQQVSQGALNKVVGQATFDQKIKEADILARHIKRITVEVENLNQAIKTGAGDQVYLAKQKLPEKEQELRNLWVAHNKLRSALAEVTVAGEKAEQALTPSPFAGLAKDAEESVDILGDLIKQIERAEDAMDMLRAGKEISSIEALVSAAEMLDSGDLFDSTVQQVGALIEKLNKLTGAFGLAIEARKELSDAGGNLDRLIATQFAALGNDPEMDKLIANLRARRQLADSVATAEERGLAAIEEALRLGIEGEALQRIILANNVEWNVELNETQVLFNEIYDRISYVAEGIAFDLVSNWRRAWEENESIVDATVDTLRDSFLNVLQDIISQWLSAWFKAMAAWLARWIATQRTAAIVSAASSGGGAGTGGGVGSLMGMGSQAYGAYKGGANAGVSANTLAGWASVAFALYVVYKGYIEDHKRKFARVEITDGKWDMTAWHGKKYMEGVQQAAEAIVKNLTKFLDDIDVTMTRLGNVIIESSKAGWNVSIPGSTGKLFASMEEAISYAQVLMAKYGEFADSVSVLVKGVITSTKAISIEQLASDIDWARMLETQNLEQAALDVSNAMDTAIANWKRAEELFLSFYSVNLPAFEAAVDSILTKLGTDLINVYNRLAGIEEDPEKTWQRQKAAYNAQRLLVLAQLKLWQLEIAARIANYNAQAKLIGGPGSGGPGGGRDGKGNGGGGGIIGLAYGMLQAAAIVSGAAEVLDPALQALLDIQALITQAINETPPELTDADYPGKKGNRGGGKNRREMRADIRDEIDTLEAEAKGALHSSFNDLNNNIAAFRDRAKEAKLPAAELAHGVELLTEAFRRSVRTQARDYAGLDSELGRRLREIQDFFDEVRELGENATGISLTEADSLESQALAKLGEDLSQAVLEFAGLSDPMMAITMRANDLRQSVLEFAEAAGWSAEQIDEAMKNIDRGIEGQRLQGINSALGNLFSILKQANLYQEEALEFERESTLLQLQVIEAQLRFYNALTAQTQAWIDAARGFVNSTDFGNQFGGSSSGTVSDPIAVKVVQSGDAWAEFSAGVKELVEAWREGIEEFTESTKSLLTDESLTNLTQAQQLDFAKSELEALTTAAKSGDLEALNKLDAARREYLSELRESEGGGFGYQKGFEWVMGQTADILANAKIGEQSLMETEFKKLTEAWAKSVDKLSAEMTTTLYITTAEVVKAIYNAIGGVPGMASGGIVMSGPRLVRIAEYVPEAIVPLDRLSQMVPFNSGHMDRMADVANDYRSRMAAGSATNRYGFMERDSLARLSAVEDSNRQIAKSLASIRDDIGVIRRSK